MALHDPRPQEPPEATECICSGCRCHFDKPRGWDVYGPHRIPICDTCYDNGFASVCVDCGNPINVDRDLLKIDRTHVLNDCFVVLCVSCTEARKEDE